MILLGSGNPLPTGNEKLLYGYKITSDELKYNTSTSNDFTSVSFELDSPDDCQHDCTER